jgi:putative phage-type endonuclease
MGGASQQETKTSMAVVRSAVGAFADHCEWTGVTSRERQAWLRARRAGIGGSDVAAILGVHPFKSALSVYADKICEEEPDEITSEAALWGTLFEPAILKVFGQRSKRKVVRGGRLLRSKLQPYYLTTLDGIILSQPPPELEGASGPGVAEIKTTGFGSDYADDLPVWVQVQIQWELWVTGATWGSGVWLPFPERRMQWLDTQANRRFQEMLAEKVDSFWARVRFRNPPDADGSESSALALRRLYPGQTDEVIRIIGAAAEVSEEYERNRAAIALLGQRNSLIKNTVAATMRDARYALLDDGRYWGSAQYNGRTNTCRHCSGVLSVVKPYKTFTLRDAPKKPGKRFAVIADVRELPESLEPDLTAALEGSLEEVANDAEQAAAEGGE